MPPSPVDGDGLIHPTLIRHGVIGGRRRSQRMPPPAGRVAELAAALRSAVLRALAWSADVLMLALFCGGLLADVCSVRTLPEVGPWAASPV